MELTISVSDSLDVTEIDSQHSFVKQTLVGVGTVTGLSTLTL